MTVPATVASKSTPATAKPAPAKAAATSCEVVREALLTGTPVDITNAMTQLQADRTASADARESASNYLGTTNKDLRSMYVSLVRMQCS